MAAGFTEFSKLTCCGSLGVKQQSAIEAEYGKRNYSTANAVLTKCCCILVVRVSSGDISTYLFHRSALVHEHLTQIFNAIENLGKKCQDLLELQVNSRKH